MSDVDVLALVHRDRLRTYLKSIVPVEDGFTVELLSGGRSNLTYLVGSGPHHYVVRRRPLGPVAAGAHDMAREYRVLAALQGSTVPVPTVYGYSDDEAIVGAPFYVMGRVAGRVFHRRGDVTGLSPEQGRSVSEATIDVLDRLHRIDYQAVGLGRLGRPEGFVSRRIGRWLEQWRHSDHRDQPLVEPLGHDLADAVPARADATLVHGDYRLGNMLIDSESAPPIAAVLDWEMSTLGDPLTDLAHLLVYWESSRGRLTHESQTIAEHPGFLHAPAMAQRYTASSGRDLGQLPFYLAFEHWRAAIIKEGIYARSRLANDPQPEGDDLGATVALHLEEAAEILRAG